MGNEASSITRQNSSKRRSNTIAENRKSSNADTVDSTNRARGNTYPPAGKESPANPLRARRESFRSSSRNSSSDKSSIFHNSDKDLPGNAHEIWDTEEPQKRIGSKSKIEKKDTLYQYNLQLNKPVLMSLKANFDVDENIRNKTFHLLKLVMVKPIKTSDSPLYQAKVNFSELMRCGVTGKAIFAHSWVGESDSIEFSPDEVIMSGRFQRDSGGKFDYLVFKLTLKSHSESEEDNSFDDNYEQDSNMNNNINTRHIGFSIDEILGTFEMCDTRNPNPKILIWNIFK